jgi:hypothetical protein
VQVSALPLGMLISCIYEEFYMDSTINFSVLIFLILNLLKPTCHVLHHQFNIQQLYALPTLYLCVLYLSETKQRLVPLTA